MNRPRLPLVAGNWKMHKGPAEARAFARELLESLPADYRPGAHPELAVFPPSISLPAVAEVLQDSPVAWGGQNCHWEARGAFTGETAPGFLAELGCRYVLVGHSERRTLFGETDETCRRKLLAVLAAGMEPVLCCGETPSERESNLTFSVLDRQLTNALAALEPAARLTIAYEPVWAIGTGRTATPAQAGEAHAFIRTWLVRRLSTAAAERTRVIYGGSVKPDNFAELLGQPDVDGALVGGASLEVASFVAIAAAATSYLTGLI